MRRCSMSVKVRLSHEWKPSDYDGNRIGIFRPRYLIFTETGSSKMEARNTCIIFLARNLHGSYHFQDKGGAKAKT